MEFSRLKIYCWQILALVLILFLAGFLIYFSGLISLTSQNQKSSPEPAIQKNQNPADCISEIRPVMVRGSSLSGLIEDGNTLKILVGYYQCHPVEREDIVAYNYAGNKVPIVKIVKGVETDKFQLKKTEAGCWNILINEEIVKNSQKVPYCLAEQGYAMLHLYEKDYNGVIPKDAYLILGNLPEGSLDSTRFGLVGKSEFVGKVEH